MKCFACGAGELIHCAKKMTYTYKEQSAILEQLGRWCDICDEGILSDEDITKTEMAFEEFKSKVDGLFLSDEIRHI